MTFSMVAEPRHPARLVFGTSAFDDLLAGSGLNLGGIGNDDVFATRCAGPTAEDLSMAMPRAFVKRSWLLRHRFSVRLSRVRVFTAGGFTGTVKSNLRLTFTRGACPGRQGRGCDDFDESVANSA